MTVMLMMLFHEVRNEVGVDDCNYTLCVWRIMALMITPAICDNGGDEGDGGDDDGGGCDAYEGGDDE